MRSGSYVSYSLYVAVGLSDPICRVAGGRQPAHPDRADTHCDTTRTRRRTHHRTTRTATHTHTTYQSSHSVQLYCGLCSRTPRLSGAPKYLLLAMARGHSRGAHGVQNCRALSCSLVGSPLLREVMRSPRNRHMPCQHPPKPRGPREPRAWNTRRSRHTPMLPATAPAAPHATPSRVRAQ